MTDFVNVVKVMYGLIFVNSYAAVSKKKRTYTKSIIIKKKGRLMRRSPLKLMIVFGGLLGRILNTSSQKGVVLLGRLLGLMFQSGPISIPVTEKAYTARLRYLLTC